MIETYADNNGGSSPQVNGGAQLVRLTFNGSIAIWDGQSAFCTVLHPADYCSMNVGEHYTLPIKDGKYDLSGLESWRGELKVRELGLSHSGPDSVAPPIPSPEQDFVMELLPQVKPIEQILEDIAKENGLDSMFDFNSQPPLHDQDPPNNRFN